MTDEISLEESKKLLQGVNIPPRPQLLMEVDKELGKDDPDLRKIAGIVSKDMAISGAMLKTLNSPFFGLRTKVTNVSQAAQMLGHAICGMS